MIVEDINIVAHVEDLVDAPGIDGFYIGLCDLTVSMVLGPIGYLENAKHAEAFRRV